MADEYTKKSDSKLDYIFDWQDWLAAHAGGDQISTSEWSTSPADSEIDIESTPATKTAVTTTVWIAGGLVGQKYKVFNKITTVGGRIETRWILLRISEVQ
ncbi:MULTISPECIES: phage fiber-tail adaptor protein [Nocardia]|uniref:phage fiber-tail adaptor protein n=1 Tax=Nocardia TaxID=1817 RepID=UPI0007A4E76D|nr:MULTISPECIES: hypothetical protein [Nocardia]